APRSRDRLVGDRFRSCPGFAARVRKGSSPDAPHVVHGTPGGAPIVITSPDIFGTHPAQPETKTHTRSIHLWCVWWSVGVRGSPERPADSAKISTRNLPRPGLIPDANRGKLFAADRL